MRDRSHSSEFKSCCELRWAEKFPCSTGKVTLVSVSTDTPSVHLLQGLFSFGLGMMPQKIPVAFTATKIINCSLNVKRKLVIFFQGYFGPT